MKTAAQLRVGSVAGRSGHGGFTMIELLVAATLTALTAAAGATFISAMTNASLTTRDVRGTTSAGHHVLTQIGKAIRECRAIGEVTPATVNLWLEDANGDDQVNLYETGVIRYDSGGRRIIYEYLKSAGTTPTTVVSANTLKDYAALHGAMPSSDLQIVVWCTDVDSLTFTGNPSYTDTRIIEVSFTLNNNGQPMTFRGADSPRASGDYLFYPETQSTPPPGSTRQSRKYVSRWTGYEDVTAPLLVE